jgi:hypothetical protein
MNQKEELFKERILYESLIHIMETQQQLLNRVLELGSGKPITIYDSTTTSYLLTQCEAIKDYLLWQEQDLRERMARGDVE